MIILATDYSVLCKLGGFVNSNLEIVSSYPSLDVSSESEILSKCFPIGSKVGDYIIDKYRKYSVLSYVFKVLQEENRDDLLAFSLLLGKRDNIEIYKPVIKELVDVLEANGLLAESVLTEYQQTIFEGMNEEKDINIENVAIDFSRIFTDIKSKIIKQKPNVKGSFF